MAAPILHVGATVLCTHAGQATPTTPFPRVLVSDQEVVTVNTLWAISGCALSGTSTPPCVIGQFVMGATRVFAGGLPVATLAGASTCTPTGTPACPVSAQVRATAT